MRAGKPLPVLYTPSLRGARQISVIECLKLDFKIEKTGTAVFGCAHPCVLNDEAKKEKSAVKLENSINYYYALKALQFLLERGLLSETEYEKVCRYNAEIFRPDREYI